MHSRSHCQQVLEQELAPNRHDITASMLLEGDAFKGQQGMSWGPRRRKNY